MTREHPKTEALIERARKLCGCLSCQGRGYSSQDPVYGCPFGAAIFTHLADEAESALAGARHRISELEAGRELSTGIVRERDATIVELRADLARGERLRTAAARYAFDFAAWSEHGGDADSVKRAQEGLLAEARLAAGAVKP